MATKEVKEVKEDECELITTHVWQMDSGDHIGVCCLQKSGGLFLSDVCGM